MLNETIIEFVDQGFQTLNAVDISWVIKLFAVFGAIWLFGTIFKSGTSIISAAAYIYGFIKWVYKKLKGEDI